MYKITYKILPEEQTKVIYGDSVTGDTPIIIKNKFTNSISLNTIETIGKEWEEYEEFKKYDSNRSEKEQCEVDFQVWSDIGWCDIKRLIRHKCNKKIFRVTTKGGDYIDVTEDHSLMDIFKNKIKPNECIGKKLLFANKLPDNIKLSFNKNIKNKIYDQYQYILKNYNYTNNIVTSVIDLGITYDYVYDIETDIGRFHAGVGKIVCSNTDSVFVRFESKTSSIYRNKVEEWMQEEEPEQSEKLSKEVKLLKDKCMEEAFAIGEKASKEVTNALFKEPILLEYEKTYNPLVLLGKKMYIGALHESNTTKWDYIDKKGVALKRRDNCLTGDSLILMSNVCSKPLKDIQINDIILSYNIDTDKLEQDTVTNKIIKTFQPYLNIHFFDGRILKCTRDHRILKSNLEWVQASYLKPYDSIIHGRKTNCTSGYSFIDRIANIEESTDEELMYDITVKNNHNFIANGIVVHNCHYLKDTYQHIVDLVMKNGKKSIKESYAYLQQRINDLINNNVQFDDLIITKKLNSEYKNENVVTLVLSKIMHDRDPGTAPKINERVPFIYIEPEENTPYGDWRLEYIKNNRIKEFINKVNKEVKGVNINNLQIAEEYNNKLEKKIKLEKGPLKQFEKVEDPNFAREHNLKIDTYYYINNQLRNPLTQFLSPIIGKDKLDELFDNNSNKKASTSRPTIEDTGDGLSNLKLTELKDMAKKLNIKTSGTKSDIVIRIRESKNQTHITSFLDI